MTLDSLWLRAPSTFWRKFLTGWEHIIWDAWARRWVGSSISRVSLLVANAVGFITKEWKGAPKASTRTLFVGLAVLVVAMGILAHGNNLVTDK